MGKKKTLLNFFKGLNKDLDRAKLIAINRAAKSALSRTMRFITATYNIKLSILKEYFQINKAVHRSGGVLQVRIIAGKKPLGFFMDKGYTKLFTVSKQMRRGVKATVRRGKRIMYQGAFIATMPSGHVGVFKRTGSKVKGKKQAIKELYAADFAKLFGDDISMDFLHKEFVARYVIELDRAMKKFS